MTLPREISRTENEGLFSMGRKPVDIPPAAGREKRSYYLNMGPQHPAMHGVIRLLLELEGEKVRDAEVEIGFLHRAFEKHAETEVWNNVIPWTDRLNYVSPLINNVGYCMAVEKLCGLHVPERGQYIRTIACEVSRVTDHLTCVAASAMELGAFTVFLYMMKARETMYQLVDKLTGARVTTSYTRVGGVKGDLPPGFEAELLAAFAGVRGILREVDGLLTKNRIFYDRVNKTGVISAADALAYGITGPFLRSTGVPYDVRRAQPYLVYDRVDFEVPVGTRGDNLDRYLVRMAEMEQSMRIVEQCFKQLPAGKHSLEEAELIEANVMVDEGKRGNIGKIWDSTAKVAANLEGQARAAHGDVLAQEPRFDLPPKEETYGSIEGLMRHFEIIMWGRGIRPPAGEAYAAVEGGNGELGFHIYSDGSDRAYRVRCRPPCLFIMAALPKMLIGGNIADIIATFGSVNMIAGELDR
ncbi:MAG: NADH-quinone oxidoreductase subunit D [Elusimicrobia bacterium]|nr:NADH-quinone oxidoreductase subunit D [Elusimicrobiota bacterium]